MNFCILLNKSYHILHNSKINATLRNVMKVSMLSWTYAMTAVMCHKVAIKFATSCLVPACKFKSYGLICLCLAMDAVSSDMIFAIDAVSGDVIFSPSRSIAELKFLSI